MARVIVRRNSSVERVLDLSDRDVRVGRGAENDLVLSDPEKGISRLHAELRREGGRYALIDLNSQNGTWTSGRRVQRVELESGVVATIGPYTIEIEATEPPPPAARSEAAPLEMEAQPGSRPGMVDTEVAAVPGTRTPPKPVAPRAAPRAIPLEPAREPTAPVRRGPVAWLARQPKPVVLGVFIGVCAVVIVLGRVRGSAKPAATAGRTAPAPAHASPATPTAEES